MTIDDDPRYVEAAIANEEARAKEIRTRALENQARSVATLVATGKFSHNSIVEAVTSGDLGKLQQKGSSRPDPNTREILIP